jgi:hypothetical protein
MVGVIRILAILLIVFVIGNKQCHATQDSCSLPPSVRYSDQRVSVFSPSLSFAPETNLKFGIYSLFYFKMGEKGGCTHPSKVEQTLTYSLNRQLQYRPEWEIYFNHDAWITSGQGIYQHYPEFIYGFGNKNDGQAEKYSHQLIKLQGRAEKKIYKRFFAGMQYQMQYMWDIDAEKGSFLDLKSDSIVGAKGGLASGLGFVLCYDSRDLSIAPSRGALFDISNYSYNQAFGSKFTFNTYILDMRKYFTVLKTHVLAFQGYFVVNTGEPPFRMMAMLGGSQLMRGYYMGRYRDRDLMCLQSEYRFPVYARFGLTVFGGLGQVAHNPDNMYWQGNHVNYGFGIRYKFNKRQNLNIRADFGFGEHNTGQYFTVGEAF